MVLVYAYDLLREHNPCGYHLRDTHSDLVIHLQDKRVCEERKVQEAIPRVLLVSGDLVGCHGYLAAVE